MTEEVITEIKDGIAHIRLNRPESYNALNSTMSNTMEAFVRRIEHRKDVKCLLFTAAGKNFSAGGDVKEMSDFDKMTSEQLAERIMRRADNANTLWLLLERIPQPVVVSVRGICAGGGLAVVGAADLTIASETASFFVAQIKIGLVPDAALSFNLRRAIGVKRAKQYCFLGDRFDARTALDIGLINWVVPDDKLEAETDALVARLLGMPSLAVSLTKQAINNSFENSLADHIAEESVHIGQCVSHPDYMNSVRAFMSRKKSA
jgi:2-(1,2-epoxy-1,2-dihydrophenyl)acetyl-CoA isomerase